MDKFEEQLRDWQRAETLACSAEQNAQRYTGRDSAERQFLLVQARRHRKDADAVLQAILIGMRDRE